METQGLDEIHSALPEERLWWIAEPIGDPTLMTYASLQPRPGLLFRQQLMIFAGSWIVASQTSLP